MAIPGPRSLALVDELARYECPAITARRARRADETGVEQDPIVWKSGAGCTITDADDNDYLDLTAAFAVASYGHSHPRLVAAVQNQAARLMHGMGDVYPTDVKIAFASALAHFAPEGLGTSIFGQSGAESVEVALKTAFMATGRTHIVAFSGAYHGMSLGALGVTAYRRDFKAPFAQASPSQVSHLPYPNCARCPLALERPMCQMACLNLVRSCLKSAASGIAAPAAVIVEPIQARGGCVTPPSGWLEGIREICDEVGALLIVDEIYTGFGRTGVRFAVEAEGVTPDIMCLGKAMTGGFPMSATIGSEEVMAAWGNSRGESIHTSTFLGNPMGCAVGLEALSLFSELAVLANVARLAEVFDARLRAWQASHPELIAEVRGRGALWGVELVTDRASKTPNTALSLRWMRRLLEEGVLVLPSGEFGHVMTFTPPLIMSTDMLEEGLNKAEFALEALLAE